MEIIRARPVTHTHMIGNDKKQVGNIIIISAELRDLIQRLYCLSGVSCWMKALGNTINMKIKEEKYFSIYKILKGKIIKKNKERKLTIHEVQYVITTVMNVECKK